MDPLLELLIQDAKLTNAELGEQLGLEEGEVCARIAGWEKDGTILGYQAVVDPEKAGNHGVTSVIDVKITPERDGGFDRLAERIAKFDQVSSCFLMSGGYDLAVIVEGVDLRDVARFVAEKLATLEGVISTTTHFQLKVYKLNGFLARGGDQAERLPVTP
ncbi:MAG: Lrp/AsnC family transcriptional regulator [Verrucomicrobiota bacterium]